MSAPAPRVERDSCSAKEEVDAFLGALCQRQPREWRGTAAQPRKKSTPSLVLCVSASPESGDGQLLSQGRSRRLPWCFVSAPAPRVERDSCSAKEEVDAFSASLESGEGQLLSQGRSRRLPCCFVSAPAPRVERDSCSAKEEVDAFLGALCQRQPREWRVTAALPRKKSTPSLVLCVSASPESGEGQLLSHGRSSHRKERIEWKNTPYMYKMLSDVAKPVSCHSSGNTTLNI